MIQPQPNRLARRTGPRSARPEDEPCAGIHGNRQGLCRGAWMPTELVRGLKAHEPSLATTME